MVHVPLYSVVDLQCIKVYSKVVIQLDLHVLIVNCIHIMHSSGLYIMNNVHISFKLIRGIL